MTTVLGLAGLLALDPSIMARGMVVAPLFAYGTVIANLAKVFLGI